MPNGVRRFLATLDPRNQNSKAKSQHGAASVEKEPERDLEAKLPTLVSFAAGDEYYFQAANSLEDDCKRLGMPHDIVRIPDAQMDWADICRFKINFYKEMHAKHGSILWVDVDDSLLALPDALRGTNFDMVGFGGRYRYIREYDRYDSARFWVPGILYFGATEKARLFIDLMATIESRATERVTDDWVLQEAWTGHDFQMNIGLLAPSIVAKRRELSNQDTVFIHGNSGNVSEFRGSVVQHENEGANPALRTKILLAEARDRMKAKKREDALTLTEIAVDISPDDGSGIVQLSRYLKICGEKERSLGVLEDALSRGNRDGLLLEEVGKRSQQTGDLNRARKAFEEIVNLGDPVVSPRAQSHLFELGFDERANEHGIAKDQRPKMWWMKTPYPGNFGDILSPWIVEKVSGLPPLMGRKDASLLAIGSVIKFAGNKSTVWGSGTPRMDDQLNPNAKYLAVRGPLTRELVIRSGGECPEVYGDPGLLLPRYYTPQPASRRYKLGVIRHVAHEKAGTIFAEDVKGISLVGVGESAIQRVVDEIASCDAILSTSLHGIIIANAYGIPARWCYFSNDMNAIAGDGTKYRDYFLSVGIPEQDPVDLANIVEFTSDLRRYVPESVRIAFDGDALIRALLAELGDFPDSAKN